MCNEVQPRFLLCSCASLYVSGCESTSRCAIITFAVCPRPRSQSSLCSCSCGCPLPEGQRPRCSAEMSLLMCWLRYKAKQPCPQVLRLYFPCRTVWLPGCAGSWMNAWMCTASGSCLWTSLQEKWQQSHRLSRYEQCSF